MTIPCLNSRPALRLNVVSCSCRCACVSRRGRCRRRAGACLRLCAAVPAIARPSCLHLVVSLLLQAQVDPDDTSVSSRDIGFHPVAYVYGTGGTNTVGFKPQWRSLTTTRKPIGLSSATRDVRFVAGSDARSRIVDERFQVGRCDGPAGDVVRVDVDDVFLADLDASLLVAVRQEQVLGRNPPVEKGPVHGLVDRFPERRPVRPSPAAARSWRRAGPPESW